MGGDQIQVTVRGDRDVAAVENALEAAADELDAELDRSRGRCADGQLSTGDALVEVARAYTGWEGGES